MSTFTLKIIAIIAMAIDHIGAVLVPGNTTYYLICRGIGRLAFPIFVFLLIEGFYHTKNVRKYLLRLGVFAMISEVPFDLAFYKGVDLVHQNIFLTLFLGLFMVSLMHIVRNKSGFNKITKDIICIVLVIMVGAIAELLAVDYGCVGILLIALFYFFRGENLYLGASILFAMILLWIYYGVDIYLLAVFAIIFIRKYNGKKGKSIKYAFYAFYPTHLILLYFIDRYLS